MDVRDNGRGHEYICGGYQHTKGVQSYGSDNTRKGEVADKEGMTRKKMNEPQDSLIFTQPIRKGVTTEENQKYPSKMGEKTQRGQLQKMLQEAKNVVSYVLMLIRWMIFLQEAG